MSEPRQGLNHNGQPLHICAADKNNTQHYDYSGLVYLSTAGDDDQVAAGDADFSGGVFDFNDDAGCRQLAPTHAEYVPEAEVAFVEQDSADVGGLQGSHPSVANMTFVLPKAGRVVLFSAGQENLHRVARVRAGSRLTLSLWFTLNPKYEFEYFLDGQPHEQALKAARARAQARRSGGKSKRHRRRKISRATSPPKEPAVSHAEL